MIDYKSMCESCYKMRRGTEFKKRYGYTRVVCNTCVRSKRPRVPSEKLKIRLDAELNVENLRVSSKCEGCGHIGHPKSWPYYWQKNSDGSLLPLSMHSKSASLPVLEQYRFLCHICVVYVQNGSISCRFFKRFGEKYENLL